MKLVALCLFAVCCSALVNPATKLLQARKLQEALTELNKMKGTLQKTGMKFNAPPQDMQEGCCLSAFECFRDNLDRHINFAIRDQRKLYKSLRNNHTENSFAFCSSGNDSTCQSCSSFPKVNGREFFSRLESLIQMALSYQSVN